MIENVFSKLYKIVLDKDRPAKHSLQYWREEIFLGVSITFLLFGLFVYIFSIIACIKGNLIFVAIFDTTVYISMLIIILNSKIPFQIKVSSVLTVLYLLGVILLISLGEEGVGYLWLFALPVLAGILRGLKAAIISVALNIFTLMFIGLIFIHFELFPASPLQTYNLLAWTSVSINFIFLNAIVAIPLGVILGGLDTALQKQSKLTEDLNQEREALQRSNVKLKNEIDQKKQLRKELYQAQKLESIGTLAGGVAHDFNNILTVIIGFSQIMLNQTDQTDPNYKNLENIYESAKRASKLTKQLLLFSRKQNMQSKPIDLNQTLSRLNKMLNRLIGEDIQMHHNLAENLNMINADEGQIEQVITNLAVNARDAMPEGGDLTISTKNVTIDQKEATTTSHKKTGRFVKLTIKDTGEGMDKNTQEQIFDPFFTTKAHGEGTGMGLSVVHGIIKKHKGHIEVSSKPGEGTSFDIYLPALLKNKAHKQNNSKEETFDQYSGQGQTVLLVEDETQVLKYLQSILNNYGYKYLSAQSGEEALEIFMNNKESIDLMISDVIMTGIDGVELADIIKNQKNKLPILLSSGYTDKKVSPSKITKKGYKFIQKPYESLKLLKMIHQLLN